MLEPVIDEVPGVESLSKDSPIMIGECDHERVDLPDFDFVLAIFRASRADLTKLKTNLESLSDR